MTINFFKINEEVLAKQISYYERFHGTAPNYLIMNSNSFNLLKVTTYSHLYSNKNDDDYYGSYWGIPIAICDKLKDGEVDII